MATPFFPKLKPGAKPTAADFNALADALAAASNIGGQALGDLGVARSLGGMQLLDGRAKGHWVKLTGACTPTAAGAAPYPHVAVASDGDGTFTDLPTTFPEVPWGTATDQPAWEVNRNTEIPAGTIVWVWPEPTGNGWLFEYSTPPSPSGSGSGTDGTGSLETIHFDVVTAVNLDACTVTTRRITITGNGLSVVTSDPPSGGG